MERGALEMPARRRRANTARERAAAAISRDRDAEDMMRWVPEAEAEGVPRRRLNHSAQQQSLSAKARRLCSLLHQPRVFRLGRDCCGTVQGAAGGCSSMECEESFTAIAWATHTTRSETAQRIGTLMRRYPASRGVVGEGVLGEAQHSQTAVSKI